MAVAPQFERERMVSDTVARATLRIGKPDRVAVKGDRIIVRSGNKRLVLRVLFQQLRSEWRRHPGRQLMATVEAGEVTPVRWGALRALRDWLRRAREPSLMP